ncbi:sulfotransferase family protein [Pseudoalteromonas gelatinilytica]
MSYPDFFVIGAAKSGTTAIYDYLKQHPEIYLPKVKETNYFHFFDRNIIYNGPSDMDEIGRFSIKNKAEYLSLYNGKENYKCGDISPVYLFDKLVPKRIYNANPNAKIIAILREPASRAISQYNHAKRQLRENLDFEDALAVEEDRLASGYEFFWAYKSAGYYFKQLKEYYDVFGKDKILVINYDDFKRDSEGALEKIFGFLGVKEFKVKKSDNHNAAGKPKSLLLHGITRIKFVSVLYHDYMPYKVKELVRSFYYKLNMSKADEISVETKEELKSLYRDDIEKLEDLTGISFKNWL